MGYYIKYDENGNLIIPDGVSLDDPEIYKQAKDQWREYLVGDQNTNAARSDEYKKKLAHVSNECQKAWKLYKNTGNTFGCEITHVSGDDEKIRVIYGHIYSMTAGYATLGSSYYRNSELLDDIKEALRYGFENLYGDNVIKGPPYHNGPYGNWWHWDIGIPLYLMKVLLILENELGSETVAKYLSPFDRLYTYPALTMANRIWVAYGCFAAAVLQNDGERILKCKEGIKEVFNYTTKGDGFYKDGSFIQHQYIPYIGGYAVGILLNLGELSMAFRGTRFAFCEDYFNTQYDWLLESFAPVIYKGNLFSSVCGREIDRPHHSELSKSEAVITYAITMSAYAPDGYKEKIKAFVRHNMLSTEKNYCGELPLCLVDYALKLKTDESVAPVGYIGGSKVFGNMDRVVQHGEKYGVCISMNSTRIYKYEAMTENNAKGWYQSDGMIYIYTDGYDYNYNYFSNGNPYKHPGTTVTDVLRKAEENTHLLNTSPFAGGVEAGKYGMAVFELGYAPSKDTDFTSDIKAYKSYFMFDNEIVAVGSGISDSSGDGVYTIIDNRFWRDNDKLTSGGSEINAELSCNITTNNLHFTNMGGYVFFENTNVEYCKNNSYLEIWLNHGKNPNKAKYSYVYLPEAAAEETTAYASSPDVEILTQTDSIHVVRENKLGITGYAFYKKGASNGVTVSDRCAVMVAENDGEYTISVSDPTHLVESLEITFELPVSQLISADKEATVEFNDGKAVVTLDISGNHGETYTVTLR